MIDGRRRPTSRRTTSSSPRATARGSSRSSSPRPSASRAPLGVGAQRLRRRRPLAHNRVANDVGAYVKLITIEKTKVRAVTIIASSGLDPPPITVTDLAAKLDAAVIDDGSLDSAAVTALRNALPSLGLSDRLAVTRLVDGSEWVLRDLKSGYRLRHPQARRRQLPGLPDHDRRGLRRRVRGGRRRRVRRRRRAAAAQAPRPTTPSSRGRTPSIESSTIGAPEAVQLDAASSSSIVATIVAASRRGRRRRARRRRALRRRRDRPQRDRRRGRHERPGTYKLSSPTYRSSAGQATVKPGETVYVDTGTTSQGPHLPPPRHRVASSGDMSDVRLLGHAPAGRT